MTAQRPARERNPSPAYADKGQTGTEALSAKMLAQRAMEELTQGTPADVVTATALVGLLVVATEGPVESDIDQLAAFSATIELAEQRGMPEHGGHLGLAHLRSMYEQASTGRFNAAKLGRWLGWAQCAVVAAAIGLELEDMAEINREAR